ncbi:MAG TPA: histidine phosphatase family protein [Woeseiaceae bacterium]|nr:histidine phosphatase family protein [Woeseiaceae bacterium]
MKTLTILRHGKSGRNDVGLSDYERPLSPRGEADAPLMAERITDAGIRPSLIMSSPAARAWATAKLFARTISYPVEFLHREDRLYLASLDKLLEVMAEQDAAFNSIVLVGHNPGLTELANHLLPGVTESIPTCGIVSLNIETDTWDLRQERPVELGLCDSPNGPL